MTLTDEFVPAGEYQPVTAPIVVSSSRRELRVTQNQRRQSESEPHTDIRFWVVGDMEIPTRSGIRLSQNETRLLRDVLVALDLGP